MIGSIERNWRSSTRLSLAPVLMLVVGMNGPVDPTRRATGYGGVVPVPAPTASNATPTRSEPLLDQQRRDLRAARGRVLYADGHVAPQNAAPRTEHKAQCPERRVVESRANPAPNS